MTQNMSWRVAQRAIANVRERAPFIIGAERDRKIAAERVAQRERNARAFFADVRRYFAKRARDAARVEAAHHADRRTAANRAAVLADSAAVRFGHAEWTEARLAAAYASPAAAGALRRTDSAMAAKYFDDGSQGRAHHAPADPWPIGRVPIGSVNTATITAAVIAARPRRDHRAPIGPVAPSQSAPTFGPRTVGAALVDPPPPRFDWRAHELAKVRAAQTRHDRKHEIRARRPAPVPVDIPSGPCKLGIATKGDRKRWAGQRRRGELAHCTPILVTTREPGKGPARMAPKVKAPAIPIDKRGRPLSGAVLLAWARKNVTCGGLVSA